MKILFTLLFFLVGGFLILFGLRGMSEARASAGWPSAEGVIVESSVRESRRPRQTKEHSRKMKYRPVIVYRYEVNGAAYEGKKVSYGEGPSATKAPAFEIQRQFPAGAGVPVFFKPSDPAVSVLKPGMNAAAWFLPAAGVVLCAFGLLSFFSIFRV